MERVVDADVRPSVLVAKHRDEIEATVALHRGSRVRVFGSIARGEDTPTSDVDLLVRFADGASLYDLVELQEALSALLRTRVDVISEAGLTGRGLRILNEARAL